MERNNILEALSRFVMEERNLEDASILEPYTNLFEAGLFDSLLAVSLVSFCESEFGCEIQMSELSEENFGSLGALADLVVRKRNGENQA
jgi:methoxymalonate biosynthesis acyl carrier protein